MKENNKLLRFLRGTISFVYGALVIVSIGLALFLAISPLLLNASGAQITASVPVAIGMGEEPRFDVKVSGSTSDKINAAFVDEAQGTLRLETTNWYFIFISNFAKLLTAIGLAYAFYLLKVLFQAISKKEIFTEENSHRLHRLGYVVLILGFLVPIVDYFAAKQILNQLSVLEPAISLPSTFKVEVVFFSLLILVIAQVWSYGLELKRDQELTI